MVIKRWNAKHASPALKASMALLAANLILKGLSLISGPIFTRIMPADEYGIASTFYSWQNILNVLITFNLTSGVFNNGMLEMKEDREVFQFSLLVVSAASGLFWLLLFFIFAGTFVDFTGMPKILIFFMMTYFIFVPAYQYWSGRQRYEFKYKLLCAIIVLIAFSSIIFGIAAVVHVPVRYKGITKVVVTESVYIFVGVIFSVYLAVRARFRFKIEYCIYALRFNLPLIPHYLSMYVLSSSDRVMISKLVNTASTAIYSVAYTVAAVINILWQSVEASLSPWIYERLGEGDHQAVRRFTVKIIALFGGICMFCTLFAPEIMYILAPSSYYSGIYIIPSIAAGVYFTAVYSLYMRIELFYKNTGFATIATSTVAVLNILLNYIFINLYGFIAAGYTTMVCYMLLSLFHYCNVKVKKYAYILNNKLIFLFSVTVVLLSVLITFLYSMPALRYSLIALFAIAAFVMRKRLIVLIKQIR